MQVISAREFRSNQSAYLRLALNGETIILTSRVGSFKIEPLTEEDNLTSRIARGLREVKAIREGKSKALTVDELFDGI